MSAEKCPKCGRTTLLKTPVAKIMTEKLGYMLHTADEYSFNCLNKRCKYTSDTIRVNTVLGKKLALPWYKRLIR